MLNQHCWCPHSSSRLYKQPSVRTNSEKGGEDLRILLQWKECLLAVSEATSLCFPPQSILTIMLRYTYNQILPKYAAQVLLPKGRMAPPKRMNFRKSSKGWGLISNPKIYIAKFGPFNRAFSAWKWYKRVVSGYIFQPITMLNCCTTCISWEIGSYNTFML